MTDAMIEDMVETMHERDAYRRVEVITGRRRRQDWTANQKARIVAESFQLGANISEVARRNGVNRGLLGVWRKQVRVAVRPSAALFAAVQIEDGAAVHDASVPASRKLSARGRDLLSWRFPMRRFVVIRRGIRTPFWG